MMQHASDCCRIAQKISEKLANAASNPCTEVSKTISVISSRNIPLRVQVVDKVAHLAVDDRFCDSCRKRFPTLLQDHELAISLRIMEILRSSGIITSCEFVGFDEQNSMLVAYLRQKATLSTQGPSSHPPIYLGPFEKVLEVEQRHYSLYMPTSDKALFATWHLSSCVGVVGFDSRQKVGFLFHVDFRSDFKEALLELVEALPKGQTFSFDYLLIGGNDDFGIEQALTSGTIKNVQFAKKASPQHSPIAPKDLLQDSYWSRAVRLARSVAVDFSKDDPLTCLMSYEAELNPYSAFHKRQNTLAEADSFEFDSSRKMKRV